MKDIILTYKTPTIGLYKNGRLYLGALLLIAVAVLVFSYNYHFLWLIYDFIAATLLLYYLTSNKKWVSPAIFFILFVVVAYFIAIVLLNGHVFQGFLSIWDTFKHLLYFPLIVKLSEFHFSERNIVFARKLFYFISFAYLMQVIAVALQYSSGAHFDDIAGTFGDGGSHAIAYISLLLITASNIYVRGWLYKFVILGVALLMNVAAENAGFFILLLLLIMGILIVERRLIKINKIFVYSLLFILAYFVLSMSIYSERTFGDVIASRFIEMINIPDYFNPHESHGRSAYLYLAYSIGGWFGHGPGAFSNIYLMQGYDFANLVDRQININEVTHLIAESGIMGLILTVTIYIIFVIKIYNRVINRLVMGSLFVACMLYSSLLMNETHIFLLVLTMYYFKISEDMYCKKFRNLR